LADFISDFPSGQEVFKQDFGANIEKKNTTLPAAVRHFCYVIFGVWLGRDWLRTTRDLW
jgi:hypothetical protein